MYHPKKPINVNESLKLAEIFKQLNEISIQTSIKIVINEKDNYAEQFGWSEHHQYEVAKSIYNFRRLRDDLFKKKIFFDPAWDILLDMFIAHYERRTSTVKSVSLASCVPMTTSLRWISVLKSEKLIQSRVSSTDARVRILTLTEFALNSLQNLLQTIKLSPTQVGITDLKSIKNPKNA